MLDVSTAFTLLPFERTLCCPWRSVVLRRSVVFRHIKALWNPTPEGFRSSPHVMRLLDCGSHCASMLLDGIGQVLFA